ncbi:hypothetical protein DYB32_005844 [Aphanomyces invadans]|uniref:Uncharacterized protein n=1 Tax=Aphanomyces invadans TaxID=157072 RepID=A0A3R6WKC6_9STRA|nr:hypothetical protein DYB32_005844 [Aphanomyces invadans]
MEASGSPKQPLVTQDTTWQDSGGSDEYVLVEREYEGIGREVLQDDNLADDLAALPNEEDGMKEVCVAGCLPIGWMSGGHMQDAAADVTASDVPHVQPQSCAKEEPHMTWQDDENRVEELLGICYKRCDA